MLKVALISLSSLETMALSDLIDRRSDASCRNYADFNDFVNKQDGTGAYIVTEGVLAANVDFFFPRKGKTIVISSGNSSSPQSGSFGMIHRNSDPEEIAELIDGILKSQSSIDDTGDLSQREKEVLKEIASGKTNKEIADSLFISVNTVITHRKNISSKLGIKSVSGLSLYALMNGIIKSEI